MTTREKFEGALELLGVKMELTSHKTTPGVAWQFTYQGEVIPVHIVSRFVEAQEVDVEEFQFCQLTLASIIEHLFKETV
jgi:hypothetical protein